MEQIMLPARGVTLRGEYDVLVAGGGTAGAFAGIAAARQGLRVLVVEQYGSLGGSATMGLVMPMMSACLPQGSGRLNGHTPLGLELFERLRALDGAGNPEQFDPLLLSCALEDLLLESGCELLYHTMLADVQREGDRVTQAVLVNKDGISVCKAACFVDCTGDADLAARAGADCEVGDDNGNNQPVSLRFEMAGVDYERFKLFLRSIGDTYNERYFAMNTPGMAGVLEKARADGILTSQDISYFQAFSIPGRPDAMAFNCPELSPGPLVCGADFLTQKQIEGKRAILRLREFLRKYVDGLQDAYITSIAPMVGLRDSRRIVAEYSLSVDDVLHYRKFPDGVVDTNYAIDVHGVGDTQLGLRYDESVPAAERYWQVPFRCTVARGFANLLVAGRCSGFDFRAQSAARVQLICRALGEAAGTACALAKERGEDFRKLDGTEVVKRMWS